MLLLRLLLLLEFPGLQPPHHSIQSSEGVTWLPRTRSHLRLSCRVVQTIRIGAVTCPAFIRIPISKFDAFGARHGPTCSTCRMSTDAKGRAIASAA
jgi:hypothetical protein